MWVDHMVDHFSNYLYQKRSFYYFSRRVPKDVQPLHGKQRIVLALNTRSKVIEWWEVCLATMVTQNTVVNWATEL